MAGHRGVEPGIESGNGRREDAVLLAEMLGEPLDLVVGQIAIEERDLRDHPDQRRGQGAGGPEGQLIGVQVHQPRAEAPVRLENPVDVDLPARLLGLEQMHAHHHVP